MINRLIILFLVYILNIITPLFGENKTGNMAPNIILRDLNNKLVITREVLKEKPVIISFFFTACVPCKKEIPELEKLKEKYKDKIRFILIATDKEGADAVKPYAAAMKITMDVLIDKYQDIVHKLSITKYPSMLVIGTDGMIKFFAEGYNEKNILSVEEVIKNIK